MRVFTLCIPILLLSLMLHGLVLGAADPSDVPRLELEILKTYDVDPKDVKFVKGEYPLLVKMRDAQGKELGYYALCDIDMKPRVKFPYTENWPNIIPSRGGTYFLLNETRARGELSQ